MTRVLSGAALIAFAVAVVWFAPLPIFEAVAFAALFAAVEELIALFTAAGVRVPHWPTVVCALLMLATFSRVINARDSADVILMGVLLFMGIVMLATWRGGSDAVATVSASLFPSLYLAIPIGAVVAIRESAGPAPLFLLMLTVIVSDSAQYYTGRLAGRRLLAPTISPKKTIEGAIGGVVFGACNIALQVQSKMLAGNAGVGAEEAAKEWAANVIHGITIIPSGTWGVNRAQEGGCTYCAGG